MIAVLAMLLAAEPSSGARLVDAPRSASLTEEPAPPGYARIHLITDDPDVRLYKQSTMRDGRAPSPLGQLFIKDDQICQAPCGILVDVQAGQQMYLGGPGMPSTPKFNLLGRQGDVVIDVHGGSYGELVVGGVGWYGGLVTAGSGVALLIVGVVLNGSTVPFVRSVGNVLTVGGGVGIGLGVAFSATGLYLLQDGQTRYEVLPSGTRPPADLPSTLQL